jgi:hypothetical protein
VSGSDRPQDPVVLGRDGVLACLRRRLFGVIAGPAQSRFRALIVLILLAGCAGASGCSLSAPGPPTGTSPSGPSLTPVPGGATAEVPPTWTDTTWGRIWDALPPSFPLPVGSVPTEPGEGPVSGTFAVGASAEQAADSVMAGLMRRRYTIEARSNPSEDGSVVIDAVGAAPDCRVQVRLTPLSGTTHMVVMFGAGCPFE